MLGFVSNSFADFENNKIVSFSEDCCLALNTHDVVFSNRPKSTTASKLGRDVIFANYGEYWRQMKSICVWHLVEVWCVCHAVLQSELANELENELEIRASSLLYLLYHFVIF